LGPTASETNGKLVKVTPGLVTPFSDAVITLVPDVLVVASPAASIVATDKVADAQDTELVMSCVAPPAKVPVAVNCSVTPSPTDGLPGVTVIDVKVGRLLSPK